MMPNTMLGHPKLRSGLLLALLLGGCNLVHGNPTWKAARCIQPGSAAQTWTCSNGLTCCYNDTSIAFCCSKDIWKFAHGEEDLIAEQPKHQGGYHFGRYHAMGGGLLTVVMVVCIMMRTGCVCARVALLTSAIKPEEPRTTYTRFSNPPSGNSQAATATTSVAPAALGWRRQHLDAVELSDPEKSQTAGNESANEASLSSTVEASNWLDRFDNRVVENCTNAMKIQHPSTH